MFSTIKKLKKCEVDFRYDCENLAGIAKISQS